MKKNILFIALIAAFGLIVSTTLSSCKTKEGCGLQEKYAPPIDKDGRISKKRKAKSGLFSKKQKKNMKKRGQG